MATLTINGERYELDVPDDMPLLWVIRDVVGLKGTKFGCGMSQCGACTVHLNGTAIRSCVTPVSAASGEITTIEAMADDPVGSKVQQAWGGPVRILPGWPDHERHSAAKKNTEPRDRGDCGCHGRESLSLRHLQPHSGGD